LTDEEAGPIRLITDTASLEAACKRLATGGFLAGTLSGAGGER
jgi:hypothetical protein